MRLIKISLISLSLSMISCVSMSKPLETLAGRVIYVDDGDTIVLLQNMALQRKIRLSSIDAPESSHTRQDHGRVGQPYSENSKNFLASLLKGKDVVAHCFEADRYGRDVCEIFLGERSVNQDMVRFGWAWANASAHGRYLRDRTLPSLEEQARLKKIGLWLGIDPVAPWIWRDACWKQGRC